MLQNVACISWWDNPWRHVIWYSFRRLQDDVFRVVYVTRCVASTRSSALTAMSGCTGCALDCSTSSSVHLTVPTSRDVNETMTLTRPRRLASSPRWDRDLFTFPKIETKTEALMGRDQDIFRDLGSGSKRRIFSATECILAVQGHPRSMILVPIESAYVTSYLSSIVTMVLSCTVSEIRWLIG